MARIDFIVTAYNQAAFLPPLLDSLKAQTLTDWRAVLIDDGSSDDTAAVAHAYASTDARIAYLRQANGGPSRARNAGAAAMAHAGPSPYLCFLDGDDALLPDFARALVHYLERHSEVGAVTCAARRIDPTGRDLGLARRTRRAPGPVLPRALPPDQPETPFVALYCATGQGPFAVFRRTDFDRTLGWTAAFWPHEDTDLFCQIGLKAGVHALPDQLYLKREHPRSVLAAGEGLRSPHFRPDAYHRFRQRWCLWQPADAREARLLDEAHRYYMRWFRPLRDLSVVGRALRAFLRSGQARHLHWALFLLRRAAGDLLRYHLLRRRPDRAQDLARFPLGQ